MKKLMLIEDELILGESLVDVLEMQDYQVIWLQSLNEFNDAIIKESVDIICCDFHLPDGSFVDIYSTLKENNLLDVPLLVISATGSEKDKGFLKENVEHVLFKPFSMAELIVKLKMMLGG